MKKRIALSTLVFISRLASAQPSMPPPVDLSIQDIEQEQSEWCWVAAAQQIILASQGSAPEQCELVELAKGQPSGWCCLGDGQINPSCNVTGQLPEIENLIYNFSGRRSLIGNPTSPAMLYHALSNGKAVILQVNSGGGNAHAIVLRGMHWMMTPVGPKAVLHINDPMQPATLPMSYDYIASYWLHSIVVQ